MRRSIILLILFPLMMLVGIPIHPVGANQSQAPWFPATGMCTGAPDTGGGAASTDYSLNHKVFYNEGFRRYWVFYTNNTAGASQGLNYASFTGTTNSSATGKNRCDNLVEGIVPNSAVFTSTKTGAEYSVDANSTTVFVEATPRTQSVFFWFGALNANGVITGWSARQTVVTISQSQYIAWDGNDIRWETTDKRIYLFYNNLSGVVNFVNSQEYYVISTNSALTTFSAPIKITTFAPYTTTHSQNDIPLISFQLGGGSIYAVYGQFFQQNVTGDTVFHGVKLTAGTVGATDTIAKPVGIGATLLPAFFYAWSPSLGVIAGNFAWASVGNQTLINDLNYATWSPGVGSVTPVQINPDVTLNPIAKSLNLFPYTACETFDVTLNQLSVEVAAGSSPWNFFVNDVFTTVSSSTPAEQYINLTSHQVTLPVGWSIGNGANAGTGICTQYTNSLHQVLWGYLNGTNVSNKCNGANGGGVPCQMFFGMTTLQPVPVNINLPQTLLYQDNFIYPYQELSNGWIVDQYATSTIPAYTQGGFLVFNGPSTPKTIHIATPSFSPNTNSSDLQSVVYPDGAIVQRKLTVTGFPFSQSASNTATIKVGFSQVLTTGVFPGSTPYGTPYYDTTGACASDGTPTNKIGSEYIAINNQGSVTAAACGDGGSNLQSLETGLNPALFTVLTIETNAVYLSGGVDNMLAGSAWAWFRIYQETSNGTLITSTDKNLNFTSNVAPLYQKNYVFLSLQTNGAAAVRSSFNLVNLQNHFTPVQVIPTTGVPLPLKSTPGLPGLFAQFALLFGDETVGGYITFGIFLAITITFLILTKSVLMTSALGYSITGAFAYMGFVSPALLYLMIIAMTFLLVKAVMKVLGIGGGEDDGTGGQQANVPGVGGV